MSDANAHHFLTEFPSREAFLAAINGPDRAIAERAVRDLGAFSGEDLIGDLTAVRSRAPTANAFESALLNRYDRVAGQAVAQ